MLTLATPFVVEDRQLWTNPNGPRTATASIVVHHAGAFYRPGKAVADIYAYHSKKWPDYHAAAYHEILQIEADGTSIGCHIVNDARLMGAGVWGRNEDTFHICAASKFVAIPDDAFIEALAQRVAAAKRRYPTAQIVGHKDIALPGHGTDCPGDLWAVWKPRLLARVEAILAPSLGPTPDAPRPYRFRFPQVVFTAPDPIAPLAVGPTSGALLYIADAEVQIGEIKNGWAWIKTGPGRLDGPGFVPLSVLEAA
jgi:hypothetical protein